MKADERASELQPFESLSPIQQGKPLESEIWLETKYVTTHLLDPSFVVEDKKKVRVIRVSKKFRMRWDLLTMLLAVYNCVTVPFFVAFYDDSELTFLVINTTIDCIFLIDIVLNFYTSYINGRGEEIRDRSMIAKNYARRMFVIDLLASVPLDNFYIAFGNPGEFTTLIQLSDLLKLLRILRLRRILRFLRVKNQAKAFLKLLQLIFYLVLWVHFTACVWFLVVRESQDWIPIYELGNGETTLYTDDAWHQYLACLYHGVWLLVGGEVAPQNWPESFVAVLFLISGAMVMAALLGEITLLVAHLNMKDSQVETLLDEAITITQNLGLSSELERKMMNDIVEVQDSLNKQEEFDYFQDLVSPSLLRKVNLVIYEPIMKTNYIMQLNDRCRQLLMNNMQTRFAIPEEDLIIQGSASEHLFFLIQGECQVFIDNRRKEREIVCELKPGAHFGEVGVIYGIPRTATVVSHRYSTVTQLPTLVFRSIIKAFPKVLREFKRATVAYRDPWKEWKTQSLLSCTLFRTLNPTALSELVYQMMPVTLQPGDYLFRPGEPCKGIFFVADGILELSFTLNSRAFHKRWQGLLKPFLEVVPLFENGDVVGWAEPGQEGEFQTVGNYAVELVLEFLKPQTLINKDLALINAVHHTQCKALHESTVYFISNKVLQRLSRDQPAFHKEAKKRAQALRELREKKPLDPIDTVYPSQNRVKRLWKSAVLRAIMKRRKSRTKITIRLRGMLAKLHAAVLCEEVGDQKSADLVLKGKIPSTAVLEDGSIDDTNHKTENPNVLMSTHPIIKGFRQFGGAVIRRNGDFKRYTRRIENESFHLNDSLLAIHNKVHAMRDSLITHIRGIVERLELRGDPSSQHLEAELEAVIKGKRRAREQSSQHSDSPLFQFYS